MLAGRNVSTVLFAERLSVPATAAPLPSASSALAALAPLTVAGSMARENVTTIGLDSGTFVEPSAGEIAVTAGADAARRRFAATTSPALAMAIALVPLSLVTGSSAVSTTAPATPVRAAAAYTPVCRDSATTDRLLLETSAPPNGSPVL